MELSPDQLKTMAENRLKAKAKVQERERLIRQHAASQVNAQGKRPLQVLPSDHTSPTAPNTRTIARGSLGGTPGSSKALQDALATGSGPGVKHFQGPDVNAPLKNMIGTYVEYDLSTLKNSKGGFLMENEEDDPKRIRERQQMEELKRKRLENERKRGQLRDPAISMDQRENPKCVHCGSVELDSQLRMVFGVLVCPKDKAEHPEKYSLLTKTECKEDYLLTEPELKDEELLPHLLRPNPHRPTYSNMMLFLRCQVEDFAFSDKKWGSEKALDEEFERRESEKQDKKSKKFAKRLHELRKKTKTNVWHKRTEEEHQHAFGDGTFKNDNGEDVQRCEECGFEIEVEVF